MADQQLTCSDCQAAFVFNEGEQAFYKSKNLKPPRRCKACRDKRRAQRDTQQFSHGDGANDVPGVHEENVAANGASDYL